MTRLKKPVIFDSNVWIGGFSADDSLHRQALKVVAQYDDRLVVVPEYTLLEVTTILKQQLGHQAAVHASNRLTMTTDYSLLPAQTFFNETLEQFQTMFEPHLSFVDVSLLVLSKTHEIVTFDKKLARAIAKDRRSR